MSTVEKVLFMGSKELGLSILRSMYEQSPDKLAGILTLDDSSDGRNMLEEIRSFAEKHSIPLCVAKNRKESEEFIREVKPDLCFVACWYWLITEEILDFVPEGFIGIHYSLLPKYRGSAPLVWQILRGEPRVGLSFFSFTPAVDAGDIWIQESIEVKPQDSIGDLLPALNDISLKAFKDNYLKIINKEITPRKQDHSQATYCAARYPFDGEINWSLPAEKVHDFIRAQSRPYPGAFSTLDGEQVIIWKARIFENEFYGTSGQVAQMIEDGVVVTCGQDSAVVVEEIEVDGKVLRAGEYLKSLKMRFK